jgi:hypothetical protein
MRDVSKSWLGNFTQIYTAQRLMVGEDGLFSAGSGSASDSTEEEDSEEEEEEREVKIAVPVAMWVSTH